MPVLLFKGEPHQRGGDSPSQLTVKGVKLRKIAPPEFRGQDFVGFGFFVWLKKPDRERPAATVDRQLIRNPENPGLMSVI